MRIYKDDILEDKATFKRYRVHHFIEAKRRYNGSFTNPVDYNGIVYYNQYKLHRRPFKNWIKYLLNKK